MPPEAIAFVEATLAAHRERINALNQRQDSHDEALVRLEQKLDDLKNWIMGAMLMSFLGLVAAAAQLFVGKH